MFLGLRLTNYRAFRGHINFIPAKLTVVLGPNNSGKSSLAQAVRILYQTANIAILPNVDGINIPLATAGKDLLILDPSDLFHKKGSEPLAFAAVFKLDEKRINTDWVGLVETR